MASRHSDRSPPDPVRPDRVRRIQPGFAFVPNRFLHGGFFASLNHSERSLYLFLVLAGDRRGVSYYGYDRICTTLEITLDEYLAARHGLIDKDLVAFDGTCFQVLSLPARPLLRHRPPLETRNDIERDNLASVARILHDSLDKS